MIDLELDPVRVDLAPERAAHLRDRAHAALRGGRTWPVAPLPLAALALAITQLAWATLATLSIY